MRPIDLSASVDEQIGQLDAFVHKIEGMIRTEGWKVFDAYLAKEEERAFLALHHAMTGDAALAAKAAYVAIKQVRELPLNEMKKASEQVRAYQTAKHRGK